MLQRIWIPALALAALLPTLAAAGTRPWTLDDILAVRTVTDPQVSPDGKWLVYATRYDAETGLRLRDLTSGDEQWLVYPVTRDDQESRFTRDLYPGYSFTPDNQSLVVSFGGKIHRVAIPSGRVTEIPFTAKVDQQIGPMVHRPIRVDTGMVLVRQIRNATPSPDGKRLAFSALDRLYVMDLPNGTPRRLTSDTVKEQVPAWSPDGQWLAYVTWTDQGGTLNKIKADGRSRPVRLTTDTAFYDTPVWSPDGAQIAFHEARFLGDILTIKPDGTGLTTILRSHGGRGISRNC